MTDRKTADPRAFVPTAQDLKMVAAMAEGGLSLEAIRQESNYSELPSIPISGSKLNA